MKWKYIFPILVLLLLIPASHAEPTEPLLLTGNATLVLDVLPTDNITLRGNASLTLRNIHQNQIIHGRVNSTIIHVYDNAKITLVNTSLVSYIHLYNESEAQLVDSSVFHAYWCNIHQTYHNGSGAYLRDDSRLTMENSQIGYVQIYESGNVNVHGGSVMELLLKPECSGVTANIMDCDVGRVHLSEVSQLEGIRKGHYDTLFFNQMSGATVNLQNSSLTRGVSVTNEKQSIHVVDCDLFILEGVELDRVTVNRCYAWDIVVWETGESEFTDCVIDYLSIIDCDSPLVYVTGCKVGRFDINDISEGTYRLIAENSVFTDFYQDYDAELFLLNVSLGLRTKQINHLYMSGVFNLENNTLPLVGSYEYNVTVRRIYPVHVTRLDADLEGALIEVLDGDEVIAASYTDAEGLGEVAVLYADVYSIYVSQNHTTNINDSYQLRVTRGASEHVESLDVYSLVPITVDLKQSTDRSLLYRITGLLLITMVFVLVYASRNRLS